MPSRTQPLYFLVPTLAAGCVLSWLQEGCHVPAILSPWKGDGSNYLFMPVAGKAEISSTPAHRPYVSSFRDWSQIALSCTGGWDSKCWQNSRLW